ncbi:DJ-1/PfpI family protein, partial [Streptomyces sp. GC420]|uniref:DJ-1/PfpI family protein n=1 Tax=Streptomyces sp. GC420 TaxID=2697568 RepID=UPI001AA159A4
MTKRAVLIVLFEGVQSLDVTGPLEVFAGAAVAAGERDAYRISTASLDGGPVRTHSGLLITPDRSLDDAMTSGPAAEGAASQDSV